LRWIFRSNFDSHLPCARSEPAAEASGTAAVMASGPNHVVLTAGTSLTVRLTEPATFQVPLER
jgi:hypothetical protein